MVARAAVAAPLVLVVVWLGLWTLSYPILGTQKKHAVHSIVTYDLAGISRFSGKNYFPVGFDAAEVAKISTCYTPQAWDVYAWGACDFVVKRLQRERLWGSAALWRAWIDAVRAEPAAYLRHRAEHFWHFMANVEYIFHTGEPAEDPRVRLATNPAFKAVHDYVLRTQRLWMFRPVFWLALSGLCLLAARRCSAPSRRFVTAVCLSSLVYLGTYFFVGVASDFRYAYWAVLATSAGASVVACEWAAAWRRSHGRTAAAAPAA